MYSISKICSEFNLSRSTLLYYDKIGLLKPQCRSKANYRLYSDSDKKRLRKICSYREAGIPLEQIGGILDKSVPDDYVLEGRLQEINKEIRFLKLQQGIIVEMLKSDRIYKENMLDKDVFTNILKSAGISDKELDELHIQFEKSSPEAHQIFLEFLGLSHEEIFYIRNNSKT